MRGGDARIQLGVDESVLAVHVEHHAGDFIEYGDTVRVAPANDHGSVCADVVPCVAHPERRVAPRKEEREEVPGFVRRQAAVGEVAFVKRKKDPVQVPVHADTVAFQRLSRLPHEQNRRQRLEKRRWREGRNAVRGIGNARQTRLYPRVGFDQ
ncbi:MAG: hypothetical protein BWY06_03386 [Candidatus Latescibacteria bacterium ADurb.Bin168]|nr:MAG: hypothetical protein BWY06_03386 [Candidatus Latescibacteria bacterium ADurb.Bin168]